MWPNAIALEAWFLALSLAGSGLTLYRCFAAELARSLFSTNHSLVFARASLDHSSNMLFYGL